MGESKSVRRSVYPSPDQKPWQKNYQQKNPKIFDLYYRLEHRDGYTRILYQGKMGTFKTNREILSRGSDIYARKKFKTHGVEEVSFNREARALVYHPGLERGLND